MKQFFVICLIVLSASSCKTQHSFEDLKILFGTWKIEGKANYEYWVNADEELKGYSYKIVGEEKQVMETLTIKVVGGKVVYEALVPNQNNGKTIPFVLNTEIKEVLSFENNKHDFPKKIRYKKVDSSKLFVEVLGEGDQGFSYYLIKQ